MINSLEIKKYLDDQLLLSELEEKASSLLWGDFMFESLASVLICT